MKDGAIALLRLDTLQVVFETRHTRDPIHVVRFTTDGTMLAAAAADGYLYLYDCNMKEKCLSLRRMLRTHCNVEEAESARTSLVASIVSIRAVQSVMCLVNCEAGDIIKYDLRTLRLREEQAVKKREEVRPSSSSSSTTKEEEDNKPDINDTTLALRCNQEHARVAAFSLDFSIDKHWLQAEIRVLDSTSSADMLQWKQRWLQSWNLRTGLYQQPRNRRKVVFSTYTVTCGWAMKDLHFNNDDVIVPVIPTRATRTARRPVSEEKMNDDSAIRAPPTTIVGDVGGRVSLSRWPCASSGRMTKSYNAHSGPVTSICVKDSSVFSAGGHDGCMLHFDVHIDEFDPIGLARKKRLEMLTEILREKSKSLKELEKAIKTALFPLQRKKRRMIKQTEELKKTFKDLSEQIKGKEDTLEGLALGTKVLDTREKIKDLEEPLMSVRHRLTAVTKQLTSETSDLRVRRQVVRCFYLSLSHTHTHTPHTHALSLSLQLLHSILSKTKNLLRYETYVLRSML